MTARDGFKFGIGFITAKCVIGLICDLLDKKSKLRKELNHTVDELKSIIEEPSAEPPYSIP